MLDVSLNLKTNGSNFLRMGIATALGLTWALLHVFLHISVTVTSSHHYQQYKHELIIIIKMLI